MKIRLGVIGCGVIGHYHMKAAKACALVELTAIADVDPAKLNAAAAEFGVEKTFSDGAGLIEDASVDAVVMALPTAFRVPLVPLALEKGKHVLIEKPVAMCAAEVEKFIRLRGELTVGCCSCRYRLLKSARAATAFLTGNRLGNLRLVRMRNTSPIKPPPDKPRPAWRMRRDLNGGGILANWGCYDLDFMLGINDWRLNPVSVCAAIWPTAAHFMDRLPPGSDAETHFTALIRCDDESVISFERGEQVVASAEQAWQIVGDRGSLQLMMTPCDNKKIVFESYNDSGLISETIWEGNESADNLHNGPVDDFAHAITEKRAPATTLENALVIQRITDAIYNSAEQGRTVPLQPNPKTPVHNHTYRRKNKGVDR